MDKAIQSGSKETYKNALQHSIIRVHSLSFRIAECVQISVKLKARLEVQGKKRLTVMP